MKTEKTHSTQELMLAIALRERARVMSACDEDSETPSPEKPFREWVIDAIQEAKDIADLVKERTQTPGHSS